MPKNSEQLIDEIMSHTDEYNLKLIANNDWFRLKLEIIAKTANREGFSEAVELVRSKI